MSAEALSTRSRPALGAKVPSSGPLPAQIGIGTMARRLEHAGFSSLWVSDHVVLPERIDSWYPFAQDGRATWPTDEPWYDAIVAMTMIAAATTRTRIGTAVLVLPQREPVVLAKQLASLDALSGGRLELGVGAGWLEEEFTALNWPFATRGKRMLEWIELLKRCWTGKPEAFEGEYYTLPQNTFCFPTPAHPVPILIGGHSKIALRRAATIGNGWLALQSAQALDPDAIAKGTAVMREAAQTAGQDPGKLRVVMRIIESAGHAEKVAQVLPELGLAGVDEIVVDVDWEAEDGPADAYSALAFTTAGN